MKKEELYSKEINKLAKLCDENGIGYTKKEYAGGYQLVFEDGSDVICHDYSYGHESGLLESWRMPQDNDDVTGCLTAEEVLERLKVNLHVEDKNA